MRKTNPQVSFEMDCSQKLVVGEKACDYTMEYKSVVGFGRTGVVNEPDKKKMALSAIMIQFAKGKSFTYPQEMLIAVTIFQVVVTSLTGKSNIKC